MLFPGAFGCGCWGLGKVEMEVPFDPLWALVPCAKSLLLQGERFLYPLFPV